MVESGFSRLDRRRTGAPRAHLGSHSILYTAVLWTALTLLPPGPRVHRAGRRR